MPIMPTVVNYDWYFTVQCPSCHKVWPIAAAPRPEQMPTVEVSWADDVDCPCGLLTSL